jgi:hypothetical protein
VFRHPDLVVRVCTFAPHPQFDADYCELGLGQEAETAGSVGAHGACLGLR